LILTCRWFQSERRPGRSLWLESEDEPIKNPVTGAPHRIQVTMPEGFEHRLGEICSSRISSTGGIKFDVPQGHGTLATVTQTPQGVAA
jgi:hypothetical protein